MRANGVLRVVVLAGLSVVLHGQAHATGPDRVVEVAPLAKAGNVGDLAVTLQRGDILELQVESTIAAAGNPKRDRASTGVTILSPDDVPTEFQDSLPDGYVVANAGDTLTIPWPQGVSLPFGVYAEQLLFKAALPMASSWYETAVLRYFEVSASGVTPISSEAYSALVTPTFTDDAGRTLVRGGWGNSQHPAGKPTFVNLQPSPGSSASPIA